MPLPPDGSRNFRSSRPRSGGKREVYQMTTALREAERELLRLMGTRLDRIGFATRAKGQSFHRDTDGGRESIHLSFIEHEHNFHATADVAIRFDAVEDLVHRSNKLLSKREKASTFTMGAELGNLEDGEPYRVTITAREDLEQAVEQLIRKVEMVGLPYLEKYSHAEAAYDLLSRDGRDVWVHSPIHAERAKRACALLAVLGRHSDVQSLGEDKLSFLKSVNDPGTAAVSKFLAELQDITAFKTPSRVHRTSPVRRSSPASAGQVVVRRIAVPRPLAPSIALGSCIHRCAQLPLSRATRWVSFSPHRAPRTAHRAGYSTDACGWNASIHWFRDGQQAT